MSFQSSLLSLYSEEQTKDLETSFLDFGTMWIQVRKLWIGLVYH